MKKITDNIPIISACLIFIGYLNYDFFYDHFDINISSFLTTTELIFSFLPLTIPFIFSIVGLIIFVSMELALPKKKNYPDTDKQKTIFHSLTDLKSAWIILLYKMNKENKKLISYLVEIPLSILSFLIRLVIQIFLLTYIIYMFSSLWNSGMQSIPFKILITLSVIWVVLIFANVDNRKEETNYRYWKLLANIVVICISITLLNYGNREKALQILNGKPQYICRIELDGEAIRTDSILVYIGQTSSYIFLRDRTRNENQIIKMDLVKKQSLTLFNN